MTIFDRLYFLACGGQPQYRHKGGKENKQTTKLQDFLEAAHIRSGTDRSR